MPVASTRRGLPPPLYDGEFEEEGRLLFDGAARSVGGADRNGYRSCSHDHCSIAQETAG